MKLKKIIATSLTMAMAFTLAPIAVPNQSKAATATITLSGSTSISPLAQQLAKQYAKENKGIKIFKNQNFKKFDDDSAYKINRIWDDIYQEIKDECYFVRKNEFNNVKKYSTNKARDNARIIDEYFIENLYRIVNTSNKQFSKYHVEVSYINP